MTDEQQVVGARFFPFGVGSATRHGEPDVTRGDREGVLDDREAQRAAVGHLRAHRNLVVAARTLWPVAAVAVVVAIFFGEQTSDRAALVAVAAVLVCLAGTRMLYGRADKRLAAVREADDRIGIPVPEEIVADVEQAGVPVSVLAGWFGDVEPRDPEELRTLRRARRDSLEIQRDFLDGLHRARRLWVEGDLAGWAGTARGLEPIARRATELDAELTARMAGPGR